MSNWFSLFQLPQEPGNLEDLQRRIAFIFVALTLLAIITFGVSDYFLGLNPIMVKVRVVYILLFACFTALMIRYKQYLISMNLMLGLIMGFSMMNYYYNDGFKGPTIFNLFVFVVAISIFFKKPLNLIWLIVSIGGYLTVFFLEAFGYISSHQNYLQNQDLFWDNGISIVICAVFIFLGVSYLISNYQKQHLTLTKLKKENEKNLIELSLLNQNKNHLIALLSHDLKSPVNHLSTTLELVEEGILEQEDLQRILLNLKNQSFQLSQVLDNTLGWVLTEMEGYESEFRMVNPRILAGEMQEIMKVQADKKQQKINLHVNLKSQSSKMAVKEIKIILKNFLDNAIKFSQVDSDLTLAVIEAGDSIRWEVINPGQIIPNDDQKSLFEFKGRSSKGTSREPGSGIGLSLCKKIADRLDWTVGYFRNDEGQNVFYLEVDKSDV